MKTRYTIVTVLCASLIAAGLVLTAGSPAYAETLAATADTATEMTIDAPMIETNSALDMRDDEYNTEYIFGMTKGVANSTWIPGVKVVLFIVTIPLDIVLLPFAAIGGFF
jgi:hypothetical protein